jgi:hypothetical protein
MSKFGFDVAQVKLTLVTEQTPALHPELTDTPLDHALRYADLGWYVIPVRVDKIPIDGYGLNSATKDPAVIRKIWGANPAAGIAIACEKSGLVVLDIDPRNGGHESLARLEAEHGMIHAAAVSLTQGGGEHRVFRSEPGVNYPGTIGAGLDVKYRGYILVEPSRGVDGTYRWQAGKNPIQGQLPQAAHPALKGAPRDYSVDVTRTAPGSQVVAPQVYADLRAALNAIPPDLSYTDGWFKVLQGLSRLSDTGAAYEMAREWSLLSDKPGHTLSAFNDKWRSCMREHFDVNYQTVFYLADEYDSERNWRNSPEPVDEPSELPALYGLNDFDLDNLPPIKFVIPDWLPAGKLTLFSGHGGSGKSSVMLQLGVLLSAGGQHALGHRLPDEPQRVLFVSGEDEPVVNMTRLRGILRLRPGLNRIAVDENLKFMNVAGCRATTLVDFDPRTGKHTYTALYKHLHACCAEFKPDVIITDNNSILFGGNEIDRNQIQTYIHCIQNIYPPAAVVALHHVDKASLGREDGDGWSGSTQWHNAARARWTLSILNDEMTLFLRKSNYGLDGWRGPVEYDEGARAHKLGEFSRKTREQEAAERTERKDNAKANATAEREQEDRVAVMGAISNMRDRYPSAYAALQSLGGRYDAYKKVLTKLIDQGEVMEAALPEGVKGESNRQKTYLLLRDKDHTERYKI